MRFVRSTGWEDGGAALSERLVRELAGGKQVLWLVSGGSNTAASVQIMNSITPELSRGLSIMPVDERYGEVGHADSNWAQLLKAGLAAKQAVLLPVLEAGKTFEQTIKHYRQLAGRAFAAADSIIAQLGIGDDGHIAGILPHSPAASENTALAAGYNAQPYRRLTLTFPALLRASAAYAFAFGENKYGALSSLKNQQLGLNQQPAQILKQLSEAYLYNDQVGETV